MVLGAAVQCMNCVLLYVLLAAHRTNKMVDNADNETTCVLHAWIAVCVMSLQQWIRTASPGGVLLTSSRVTR